MRKPHEEGSLIEQRRDPSLDIAKGLAIMLVVLGHTLQSMRADFDENIWARAIYAFHMPLFIFLSGAVAATRPSPLLLEGLRWQSRLTMTAHAVARSAVRLLIPFMTWTLIGWYVERRATYTLPDWLGIVSRSPDSSLWFLLLVFYCLMLWNLWHLFMGFVCEALRKIQRYNLLRVCRYEFVSLSFFGILSGTILLLPSLTNAYGIGFIKQYLIYFILGALFYLYGRNRMRGYARLVPYMLFAALVPFWYRTHPGPLSEWLAHFIDHRVADRGYRIVVASAGILAALDIVALIQNAKIDNLNRFMAYCGVASLGVYAMQFYFFGLFVPFLTPLLGGLAGYALISRIPVARVLLLGETGPARKEPLVEG
jgi:fucose 4-O-acetylase-like acetyltransferase